MGATRIGDGLVLVSQGEVRDSPMALSPPEPVEAREQYRVGPKAFVLACFIGLLMHLIPWWSFIYGDMLNEDLFSYLDQQRYAAARLEMLLAGSWVNLLLQEPLWLWLNSLAADHGVASEILLSGSGYICWCGIVLFFSASANLPRWGWAFLVNPYFIDLSLIHVRQGLALGAVLIGISFGGVGVWLAIAVAMLIHSSTALYLGAFVISEVAARMTRRTWLPVVLAIGSIFLAVPLSRTFLEEAGDARTFLYESRSESGFYMGPWLVAALLLALESRERPNVWTKPACVVLVVAALCLTFYGGAYRIVEGAFPFLVAAVAMTTGWRRRSAFSALAAFQAIQFAYKFTFMYQSR